jgi:hypothetical protein
MESLCFLYQLPVTVPQCEGYLYLTALAWRFPSTSMIGSPFGPQENVRSPEHDVTIASPQRPKTKPVMSGHCPRRACHRSRATHPDVGLVAKTDATDQYIELNAAYIARQPPWTAPTVPPDDNSRFDTSIAFAAECPVPVDDYVQLREGEIVVSTSMISRSSIAWARTRQRSPASVELTTLESKRSKSPTNQPIRAAWHLVPRRSGWRCRSELEVRHVVPKHVQYLPFWLEFSRHQCGCPIEFRNVLDWGTVIG